MIFCSLSGVVQQVSLQDFFLGYHFNGGYYNYVNSVLNFVNNGIRSFHSISRTELWRIGSVKTDPEAEGRRFVFWFKAMVSDSCPVPSGLPTLRCGPALWTYGVHFKTSVCEAVSNFSMGNGFSF